MKWDEIDLAEKTWELPASRTKNGRAHVVPLPRTAVALLKRVRTEVAETERRVFPGLTPWTHDLRALSNIHNGAYERKDLRRTVSTRLAELGFTEEVIGRTLNTVVLLAPSAPWFEHDRDVVRGPQAGASLGTAETRTRLTEAPGQRWR